LRGLVDAALVERHRRVVVQERAMRNVDVPYGLAGERLFGHLYPGTHPLRGGVIGSPAELARVTAEDVRSFVGEYLVPANATLTVVGRFDQVVARRLIGEALGWLPAGRRASTPRTPRLVDPYIEKQDEPLSRKPRVMMAWRLPDMPRQDAKALQLGAQLLTFLTDGAWGMQIAADLYEYTGESLFTVELTVPYDEPMSVVHNDADGFLRMLTHREMPLELMIAANLALDRAAMFDLDTVEGRAHALARLEHLVGPSQSVADDLGVHWELERGVLRDTARVYLRRPRIIMHARPTRPKPARVERE
jgi:predicted Zn-dependent peptidase